MLVLADWVTVLIVGWLAVASPGPNLALVLRNSLAYSRSAGIYTAVGLAVGNLVHAAYSLIGIGVVIARSILLFNIIKWLGAGYLIYIGFRSLQAKKHEGHLAVGHVHLLGRFAAIRLGFLTNLLNPKVTLFFLALFTQIIRPSTPLPAQVAYGFTMVSLEFVWFALIAVIISQRVIKDRFLSIVHWVERVSGVVLIGLGVRLAFARSAP